MYGTQRAGNIYKAFQFFRINSQLPFIVFWHGLEDEIFLLYDISTAIIFFTAKTKYF